MAEEDRTWCEIQAQCGMHRLVVSHSFVKLEAAVNTALSQTEEFPAKAFDCLVTLKDEVNDCVATPGPCLAYGWGGYFNNVSSHCR